MARDKANLDIQWQRVAVKTMEDGTSLELMREILKDLDEAMREFANAESEINRSS
jgi:hypothetical protein